MSKPARSRKRRPWGRYFFEFFMLFFAITLGFFVENLREEYSDLQREKQFVKSLINDIEADKANLTAIIHNRDIREVRLDSLLFLINSDSSQYYSKDIYFFSANLPRIIPIQFFPNDGTIRQLLNAGGLSLIQRQAVVDSIVRYDAEIRLLNQIGDQEKSVVDFSRSVIPKVLNGPAMDKMSDANSKPIRIDFNPPLAIGYKDYLNDFSYRVVAIQSVNKGYRRECRKLLNQSTNLLATLKKEYHVE